MTFLTDVVRTRAEIEGETRPGCVADQVLALSNK
jgi:hypothetical protein